MHITASPTFCSAPWTSLNIDQTGRVMPCQMTGYELGNLRENTIQEILQNQPLRELKQTIAQGQWHTACEMCKQNESVNNFSARTSRGVDQDVKLAIDSDIDFFYLQDICVNWSNLCNITCVYCNPETSTAWQSVKKIPINYVRNQQEDLVQLAREQGSHIRGVMLGGGEPLLQKTLPDFIDALDPSMCRVIVTTNLSVDINNNNIYQRLKNFKNISWMISFDNADARRFEYVRKGAIWQQFYNNLLQLKHDKQHVWAHPAYSIYCALDLENYYDFCHAHDLDLFWCDLTHPWSLDARRMPLAFRQKAVECIDRVIEKYPNQYSQNTLERYRQTLIEPRLLNPEFQPNTLAWHRACEQELNMIHTFEELWPREAELIR